MKRITRIFIIVSVVLLLSPVYSDARGSHRVHRGAGWGCWWPWALVGGVIVGSTLAAPRYHPPPPAYGQPDQPYYWYYCPDSKEYYPYVKSCPSGWMRVVPDANPRGPE